MSTKEKRINKYLADRGLCSRREAETLIEKGWISVNGEVLTQLGYKVQPGDQVTVDDAAQDFLGQKMTVIIHKPIGYVSAQAEKDYIPAIRLITPENHYGEHPPRDLILNGLAPAGRLDIDSTGLLILTQNGKMAKHLIAPDSDVEKEYLVKVRGSVTQQTLTQLCHGLELDGRKLKPANVTQVDHGQLKFILTEGRKRQIRRMCELVDLQVTALKRIRVGELKLGPLPPGQWRLLKRNEKI